MGKVKYICTILVGLKGRDHFEDLGIDGKAVFKWRLRKWGCKWWIGLIWFKVGSGYGLL
jgi:hypothetical protein